MDHWCWLERFWLGHNKNVHGNNENTCWCAWCSQSLVSFASSKAPVLSLNILRNKRSFIIHDFCHMFHDIQLVLHDYYEEQVKMGTLIHCPNDVWFSCLRNIIELACDWLATEVFGQGRRMIECIQRFLNSLSDNGVNQGMLYELMVAIIMLLYVDTNIVSWMSLIFYV